MFQIHNSSDDVESHVKLLSKISVSAGKNSEFMLNLDAELG